jgi:hypothetical protein
MSKYKKIVIKTEATNDDLLSSSQVTSLYS